MKYSTDNIKITKLKIFHENRRIIVERDEDWNINITKLAKFFNKKWKDWYKHHKKKVQYWEDQSGTKQIVSASRGRYGSTWISFELAIQVLNSWSSSFSYKLSCYIELRCWKSRLIDMIIRRSKTTKTALSTRRRTISLLFSYQWL